MAQLPKPKPIPDYARIFYDQWYRWYVENSRFFLLYTIEEKEYEAEHKELFITRADLRGLVSPFDAKLQKGEVILFSNELTDSPVPRYGLVLSGTDNDNGAVLVSPFSPAPAPAFHGELKTELQQPQLQVLEIWNIVEYPVYIMKKAWSVDEGHGDLADDALTLYHSLNTGEPLPQQLQCRTGLPVFNDFDIRLKYRRSEEALFTPACFLLKLHKSYSDYLKITKKLPANRNNDTQGELSLSGSMSGLIVEPLFNPEIYKVPECAFPVVIVSEPKTDPLTGLKVVSVVNMYNPPDTSGSDDDIMISAENRLFTNWVVTVSSIREVMLSDLNTGRVLGRLQSESYKSITKKLHLKGAVNKTDSIQGETAFLKQYLSKYYSQLTEGLVSRRELKEKVIEALYPFIDDLLGEHPQRVDLTNLARYISRMGDENRQFAVILNTADDYIANGRAASYKETLELIERFEKGLSDDGAEYKKSDTSTQFDMIIGGLSTGNIDGAVLPSLFSCADSDRKYAYRSAEDKDDRSGFGYSQLYDRYKVDFNIEYVNECEVDLNIRLEDTRKNEIPAFSVKILKITGDKEEEIKSRELEAGKTTFRNITIGKYSILFIQNGKKKISVSIKLDG